MSWFLRIAAPVAMLMLVGIGASLIAVGHIYSGISLLASTVPLQWMGAVPEAARPQAPGAQLDEDLEQPPLSVLLAILLAGLAFLLAVSTQR